MHGRADTTGPFARVLETLRGTVAVASRETAALFSTPAAFVVLCLFQVFGGLVFSVLVFYTNRPSLPALYRNLCVIVLLLVPVIASGRMVEERRGTTLELLVSSGLGTGQIVAGKFAACALLAALLSLLPLQYPGVLDVFVSVDWGPVWSATLGLFLFTLGLTAIGLCAGAWASNWLVSSALGFFAAMGFWFAENLANLFGQQSSLFLEGLSSFVRMNRFVRGLVDVTDLVYFLSLVLLALFLAVQGLEMRRVG